MDARVRMLERWIVVLIAIHSAGVGMLLLLAPRWSAEFGGWDGIASLFFTRQAGVFHIVVAIGYLLDYFRSGGVTFLVVTKSIAVVFLTAAFLLGERAWAVPFSAVTDGLMGAVVAALHLRGGGSLFSRAAS